MANPAFDVLPDSGTVAAAWGRCILPFAIGCFGAQAIISGLFAAFSRFTRTTFLAYAIALLPFFAFNWWFTFVDPVFTIVGLLDAAGNVLMLGLCVIGWRGSEKSTDRL